jgi:hypothetical protein
VSDGGVVRTKRDLNETSALVFGPETHPDDLPTFRLSYCGDGGAYLATAAQSGGDYTCRVTRVLGGPPRATVPPIPPGGSDLNQGEKGPSIGWYVSPATFDKALRIVAFDVEGAICFDCVQRSTSPNDWCARSFPLWRERMRLLETRDVRSAFYGLASWDPAISASAADALGSFLQPLLHIKDWESSDWNALGQSIAVAFLASFPPDRETVRTG